MSAFSYTAPKYTPEDEKREIGSLDEKERSEISDGTLGINQTVERLIGQIETVELMSKAVAEVEQHLDSIDPDDKGEYLEAIEHAPGLVESESNPICFLRFHKYNTQSTARGIVEYWSLRKEIFGEDLFYLPMTLHEAMKQYRSALELGVFALLPDDRFGRTVLFFDRIRMLRDVIDLKSAMAVFFYLFQKMIQKSDAYLGFVNITNLRGFDLIKHFDRKAVKGIAKIIRTMPIHMKAAHFCGSDYTMTNLYFPIIKFIIGKDLRLKIVTHHGYTGKDFATKLLGYGLDKGSLLPMLGGSYQIKPDLMEWISIQESHEEEQGMQVDPLEC